MVRSRRLCPTSRSLRRRGGGLRALSGGRCPQTIAAALDRDDFESRSDSKSDLIRSRRLCPTSRSLRRRGGGLRALSGGRCPQTIAAALGRDDFESGSDSKSDLVRNGRLCPTSRSLRRRGSGLRALSGGRCPQTFAAALGRDDFESGSDSKSDLIRNGSLFPTSRSLRRRGGGLRALSGGRCPQTIAAAFGRDDFESGSDSKSDLVRSRRLCPTSRSLRRRGGCLRALSGGRCPQTFAAALGRDDFESGSDSKSDLIRSRRLFPTSRSLRRRGGGLRALSGCTRRRLLPRLVATILNREAIHFRCWFAAVHCSQIPANCISKRHNLLSGAFGL